MIERLRALSLSEFYAFAVAANVVIFVASVAACYALGRLFASARLFDEHQPWSWRDCGIAVVAVALNTLVAIVGWHLWQAGWIRLTQPSLLRSIGDFALLLLYMDFGMYCSHRAAHIPWVYRPLHRVHHTHQATNALSLFVLHPLEVVGFGALLLSALLLFPLSVDALLVYLAVNVAWGTLGHAGVELLPNSRVAKGVARWIGASTFHAGHHAEPGYNFGFYTLLWDRLFGTLRPDDGRPRRFEPKGLAAPCAAINVDKL